jgi:hypothetical protein
VYTIRLPCSSCHRRPREKWRRHWIERNSTHANQPFTGLLLINHKHK